MKKTLFALLALLSFAVAGFGETVSISSPADLIAFANRVNAGELTLDAVLTADIDMTGQAWAKPIGCWTPKVNSANVVYKGHFDGQGHAITNLTYTTAQNYHGLFGVVATGALVENFSIAGIVTNASYTEFGTVGFARDSNPTMRNIHSSLNFNNTYAGARIGGIVGNAYVGTTNIERCTYSGTIRTNDSGNAGNYGGMVGIGNNNTGAVCNITSCLFDGVIENTAEAPGNCTFGGMVGYSNAAIITIKNCLSVGTVQSKIYGQFWGAVKSTSCSVVNSYYKGDVVNGSSSTVTLPTMEAMQVSDAQLASGEVAYRLGEAFSQTIGTDAYPKVGTDGGIVILNGSYLNAPATIALDENRDFGTHADFDVASVTLARTLKADKWDVFCVPFDMTGDEIAAQLGAGTEVKELAGVLEEFGNYTLTFSDASGIVAGKSYIIKVKEDVASISLGSKTIKAGKNRTTIDDFTFVGTFTNSEAPTGSFVLTDSKTSRVTGLVSLQAFRSYLIASEGIVVNTLTFDLDGIEDGIAPTKQVSDRPTFSVIGNSISTYYDYTPSGYKVYYNTTRERDYGVQVGDQWWMQLSRMTGLSFLANAAWSGSRVAYDSSTLGGIAPFCSDARVKALGRAGNPDFIFVLGGTNDWSHDVNVPLGDYCTKGEYKDSLSFRGAYSLLLHKLTTRYPKARIVCLSILPRGESANEINAAGWKQSDGNASIKRIAEQFGQYYIDCSTLPFSSDWNKYMIAGNIHPKAAGFTVMAEHIAEALVSQGIISADLKRSDEVETAERLLDISFTQDGIVNHGTYDAAVGKQGAATTVFDSENNVYLGTTKALASDYFYATYDEDSPLAEAFNKSVTWEMLVRLDAPEDENGNVTRTCILGNEQDGGWCFYNSDYASTFSYTHKSGVKSTVKDFTGARVLVPGRFYHLVVTMDRASHVLRYFVNGKLVRTGTRAATDMPLPQCGTVKGHQGMWICLGGDATSGDCTSGAENSSACSFVFARIYGGALTEEAAASLFNKEVSKFTQRPTVKISNAAELRAFADQVNAGNFDPEAILTADIDMTGEAWPAPIGFWGSNKAVYKGHFDGQGHAITNLVYTTAQNYHGLFGVLSSDALIENFSISGTITNTDYTPFGAVAGFARDENPTIHNVWSSVNIINTRAGSRIGGILGHSSESSNVNIDCCTYSGTLEANDAGGSGNYGGIVGYVQNSESAVCNISNCLFDGELRNSADTPGNCTFGGMVGYVGAYPIVKIANCLSIGKVQSKIAAQFFGAVKNTNCSILNSYYQGAYVNGNVSGAATLPTLEAMDVLDIDLANGDVRALLGDAWYQGEGDAYPVPVGDIETGIGAVYNGWKADGPLTGDGVIFNLAGQRLSKIQKGVNVVNGRKVLK